MAQAHSHILIGLLDELGPRPFQGVLDSFKLIQHAEYANRRKPNRKTKLKAFEEKVKQHSIGFLTQVEDNKGKKLLRPKGHALCKSSTITRFKQNIT